MKKIIFLLLLSVAVNITNAQTFRKGLWIWDTSTLIGNSTQVNIVLNQCKEDKTTDIYIYAYGFLSGTAGTNMRSFISKAKCLNINVWAMDGYRGYFSDWYGPSGYYNFINQVISFNNASTANQKFFGIQGDNEPHDGQGEPRSSFHNGIPDSQLNKTGGGVWQSTQALDREHLMRDFIKTTETAYNTCHANGLLYGQAMVSWLDNYYGEPVYCTYNGVRKQVMEHIMNYLDDYFIMSYNTNPNSVIDRVKGELAYASTLPASSRPRVWAGAETHCGVGTNVSYCDTPGKNSKTTVNNDIITIENNLKNYAAYAGFNIHDWQGWKGLSPASTNSSDPGCTQASITADFTISNSNSCTGSTITFTNNSSGTITSYNWNFGSGAVPATATGVGPHNVHYTTSGAKTISLTVGNGSTTSNKTSTIQVTETVTPSVSIAITSGTNPTKQGSNVTFTATAINGGSSPSYQWKVNGTNVGSNSSTYSSTTLTNGQTVTCVITSNATCASPATSTSNSITMVVNSNMAPSVSITSPSNNATFTAPATMSISANATDSDGSISKVEFFNGSLKLGEDLTSPYTFSWNSVPAGTYNLTARATDNNGAVTTSSAITVIVRSPNAAPSVSITSPTDNAAFAAPANINITANASDTDGSITKVEFFNGSVKLGEDLTSPYSFNWNSIPAGSYTLTAKAIDNNGTSTTSTPITIVVYVITSNKEACSTIPQYIENGGYTAGSTVKNDGNKYQCRNWPNSGWCNGTAWAYAPGIGTYWQDAWIFVESCTSVQKSPSKKNKVRMAHTSESEVIVTFDNSHNIYVKVFDSFGREILSIKDFQSGNSINIESIKPGVYIIFFESATEIISERFVKN
ncbi:MAG: Ig-like domain-containing protein [Cytophagaceae bacterium]